jgi:hypothetical protein
MAYRQIGNRKSTSRLISHEPFGPESNLIPSGKGGAKVDHWGGAKGYQQSER